MKEPIEIIVSWGSVLIGLILCLSVGWLLMREVRRGKTGRFSATVMQGVAIPFLGIVPVAIAVAAAA